MGKYTCRDQTSQKVRRIRRYEHESGKQEREKHQDDHRPDDSQFLADDREDHIILRFRKRAEFLGTVAKPLPEQSA